MQCWLGSPSVWLGLRYVLNFNEHMNETLKSHDLHVTPARRVYGRGVIYYTAVPTRMYSTELILVQTYPISRLSIAHGWTRKEFSMIPRTLVLARDDWTKKFFVLFFSSHLNLYTRVFRKFNLRRKSFAYAVGWWFHSKSTWSYYTPASGIAPLRATKFFHLGVLYYS